MPEGPTIRHTAEVLCDALEGQGRIDPNTLAQHLLNTWEQNDTVAQALAGDEGSIVQAGQRSGGFLSDEPQSA